MEYGNEAKQALLLGRTGTQTGKLNINHSYDYFMIYRFSLWWKQRKPTVCRSSTDFLLMQMGYIMPQAALSF